MLKYQLFPKTLSLPNELQSVIDVFDSAYERISSSKHNHVSDEVLYRVAEGLKEHDFLVESGKKATDKVVVPVFFGLNGRPSKSFNADALSANGEIVIEVEAGRAYTNHQFLKDIFQASMMVDVKYVVVAVRNAYRLSDDFAKIYKFIDIMFASGRISLDLEGVLLIGY